MLTALRNKVIKYALLKNGAFRKHVPFYKSFRSLIDLKLMLPAVATNELGVLEHLKHGVKHGKHNKKKLSEHTRFVVVKGINIPFLCSPELY